MNRLNICALVLCLLASVYTQDCYVDEACPNDNTIVGDFVIPDVNATNSSVSTLGCIYGGEYVNVQLEAGTTIEFDTCSATWDTQISVFYGLEDYALAYNDDYDQNCGTAGTGSYVRLVAPWTGTYRISIDKYYCTADANDCAVLNATYIETIPIGPKNVTGGPCLDDNNVDEDESVTVPYVVGTSQIIACVNPGDGIRVWLNHDTIMEFDTCRFAAFDTQLTVYSERTNLLADSSDDACGCTGRSARVRVTTTDQTSYFRLLVDKFDCGADDTGPCVNINATLIAGGAYAEDNSSFGSTIAVSSVLVSLMSFFL